MDAKRPTEIKATPSETLSAAQVGTPAQEGAEDRPKKARRTFLTQNACRRCRAKKSKCDGKRPTCARCEKHGAGCVYDVAEEGITRMQHLQSQLSSRTEDYDKLKRLFDALHRGSDQEATTLLARLRLGASIDDLLSYVGEGQLSSSGQRSQQSSSQPQHGPGYTSRWPSSPSIQEGYWTTPSERSSRQPSQSSASQLGPPRSDAVVPSSDATLTIRPQENQGDYYSHTPPQGMHQQNSNVTFDAGQWQPQESSGNLTPYYPEPSTSPRHRGKRSKER